MAQQLVNERMDYYGICYIAYLEAFDWWNASMHWCRKGCDFSRRKVNDPVLRHEAWNMYKLLALQSYRSEDWKI